jgi:hypothetical protein
MTDEILPRRSEAIEALTRTDLDVEEVLERRRDLGIPDGVWWTVVSIAGVVGAALSAIWLFPRVGEWVAFLLAAALFNATLAFASRRWGHRRYGWRRAFVDGFVGVALLTLVFAIYIGFRAAL